MSSSTGRFDALFATLAQQHDGVEALLDSFFDFMHRKTDFYAVSRDPVLDAFLKYPFKDLDADGLQPAQAVAASAAPVTASPASLRSLGSSTAATHKAPVVKRTQDGKQIPVGNGGATASYTWTQSLDETTIYLRVPPNTRSRDLSCVITATHVRVTRKDAALDAPPLLEGSFPAKVRVDECLWSLESDSTTLQISLEKLQQTWWASALAGDDEIDTSQVESTRAIHEYDGETQGAIRKIVFDQQQQQAGRPTSDESLLEMARHAPM